RCSKEASFEARRRNDHEVRRITRHASRILSHIGRNCAVQRPDAALSLRLLRRGGGGTRVDGRRPRTHAGTRRQPPMIPTLPVVPSLAPVMSDALFALTLALLLLAPLAIAGVALDRKSTRLNSSH